jgi:hypothetical protein
MKSKQLQTKQFEGFHVYSEIHSTLVDSNNNNNNNTNNNNNNNNNNLINKEV